MSSPSSSREGDAAGEGVGAAATTPPDIATSPLSRSSSEVEELDKELVVTAKSSKRKSGVAKASRAGASGDGTEKKSQKRRKNARGPRRGAGAEKSGAVHDETSKPQRLREEGRKHGRSGKKRQDADGDPAASKAGKSSLSSSGAESGEENDTGEEEKGKAVLSEPDDVELDVGRVVSWGWNSFGQLGQGVHRTAGKAGGASGTNVSKPVTLKFFVPPFNSIRVQQVSAGLCHGAVLSDIGEVFTFGRSAYGRLGLGGYDTGPDDETHFATPQRVFLRGSGGNLPGGEQTASMAWIQRERLRQLKRQAGLVDDDSGGRTSDLQAPPSVGSTSSSQSSLPVSFVTCGAYHTVAISAQDGFLYTWGRNHFGQLGLGHTNNTSFPTRVELKLKDAPAAGSVSLVDDDGRSSPTEIRATRAAAWNHTLVATDRGGVLFAFGQNDHGQLGIGSSGNSQENWEPERVVAPISGGGSSSDAGDSSDTDDFVSDESLQSWDGLLCRSMACGSRFTAAVLGGNLWVWGRNHRGQLGVEDFAERVLPVIVPKLVGSDVSIVSCGQEHTVCLDGAGRCWAFGSNSQKQLGIADLSVFKKHVHTRGNAICAPARIKEALFRKSCSSVACGTYHSLALTDKGRLYSFGLNDQRQTGDGVDAVLAKNIVSAPLSTTLADDMDCIGVAAGGRSSYAWSGFTPVIDVQVKEVKHHFRKIFRQDVGELADISLFATSKSGKIKGKRRKCHRVVLASASSRFSKIFHVVSAEKQTLPSEYKLTEKCWRTSGVLEAFLEYCYTDKVSLPESIAEEEVGIFVDALEDASSLYGVPQLVRSLQLFRYMRVNDEITDTSVLYVDPSIPERFAKFVNSPSLADVKFIFPRETVDENTDDESESEDDSPAPGHQVWAHKCILASRSSHFRAMLTGGFQESSGQDIDMGSLGVGMGAFQSLIRYCYTNSVEVADDDLVELLMLSHQYELPHLTALCERQISRGVDVDNCAWLFSLSDHIGATELRNFSLYFAQKNWAAVLETEGYKSLDKESQELLSAGRRRIVLGGAKQQKEDARCVVQ